MKYSPRLKILYKEKIIFFFKKKFNYKNIMQVPKLEKIVINQGLGIAVKNKKIIDYAIKEITSISGQLAVPCYSKKDEAGFNLRKKIPIGCKVTLRRDKMYEFLDRLITISLPRVRDFNGIKENGFDGRGNYNLGIKEQIIFPEINIDKVKIITGMNISFITNTDKDELSKLLLIKFGLPFKKKQNGKRIS
ncbi:50S ribosomal protein L5 [Candidatus Shikimatogenerans silvanidophilus]|uniref:50S ribosomal protein L5 n=1 Tax=Candidatus Shikimatogenerans silvanidophilus TaxID=2782547 RepID=UPI001BA697A4|nr:50S ribosomal protein L5 [Candidatus Shikimatogenerans silvanidophilus]